MTHLSNSIPHFSMPFRFSHGRAATVEQDSSDEVTDCVANLLRCPLGFREELHDYGISDPTFQESAINTEDMRAAIDQWEPRADAELSTNPEKLNDYIGHVIATSTFGGGSE